MDKKRSLRNEAEAEGYVRRRESWPIDDILAGVVYGVSTSRVWAAVRKLGHVGAYGKFFRAS